VDQEAIFPTPAPEPLSLQGSSGAKTRYITGFWRRLFAFGLDLLILALALAYPVYRWFSFFLLHPGWTLFIGFATTFIYFVILNSRLGKGQTMGKRAMGIRVVNIRGETISVGRSALRFLVLALPFYGDKAQFTCNGQVCALTTIMPWLFEAWELVIVYLFIFNRQTRQSLHDLVASTYVIEASLWQTRNLQLAVAGGATSSGSAPLYVTSQRLWREHWVIFGAILLVGTVFAVSISQGLIGNVPYGELAQIQQAVLRSGKARMVGVKIVKNWIGKRTTTHLEVSFYPTSGAADYEKQAAEIAGIVLESSPNALEMDLLDVVVLREAEFGFLHISANRSYSHTPSEWRRIVFSSGTRKGSTAWIGFGPPNCSRQI
jgi:uncharacterized RDD family membrane protein YckC